MVVPISAVRGRTFAPPASTAPPMPPFANVAGCWGLFNLNPVGYPLGSGVNIDGSDDHDDIPFLAPTPYPLNWEGINPALGTPPYLTNLVYDQNAVTNNLAASGSARPTLDAVNKLVAFDGIANILTSESGIYGGDTTGFTFYLWFKMDSLTGTQYVVSEGTNPITTALNFAVRTVSNVLTVSVTDATGLLLNTKIKTIDTGWHLLSVVIDTTKSAANQVLCWLDGSQTGWSAPISTSLASNNLDLASLLVVGAKGDGINFAAMSMTDLFMEIVAQDTTTRQAWESYITSINT